MPILAALPLAPNGFFQYPRPQYSAYELRLAGTKNLTGGLGRGHGLLSLKAVQDASGHLNQYYKQKTCWSLDAYRIRRQNDIEPMVNLINLVHNSLKILPYLDEHFAKYQNAGLQELRSHIRWQIQREIFWHFGF